jgi:hypothetical protein
MLPMWAPTRYRNAEYMPLWMYGRNECSKSVIEVVSATTRHWIKKKFPPTHHDDFLYEMQRDHSKDSKVA